MTNLIFILSNYGARIDKSELEEIFNLKQNTENTENTKNRENRENTENTENTEKPDLDFISFNQFLACVVDPVKENLDITVK